MQDVPFVRVWAQDPRFVTGCSAGCSATFPPVRIELSGVQCNDPSAGFMDQSDESPGTEDAKLLIWTSCPDVEFHVAAFDAMGRRVATYSGTDVTLLNNNFTLYNTVNSAQSLSASLEGSGLARWSGYEVAARPGTYTMQAQIPARKGIPVTVSMGAGMGWPG